MNIYFLMALILLLFPVLLWYVAMGYCLMARRTWLKELNGLKESEATMGKIRGLFVSHLDMGKNWSALNDCIMSRKAEVEEALADAEYAIQQLRDLVYIIMRRKN
jgi:hypothetical protein